MTETDYDLDPQEEVTPLEFGRRLTRWLEGWATNTVQDANTAYLDRLIKAEVESQVAKQLNGRSDRERARSAEADGLAAAHFVEAFVEGRATGWSRLESQLNNYIQRTVEGAVANERAVSDATATGDDKAFVDVLDEKNRELEAALERLRAELDRAHEWRFHLESRARVVYETVQRLLKVAQRAPTHEEMTDIELTLYEAIQWHP